jgi:hypothetical protein
MRAEAGALLAAGLLALGACATAPPLPASTSGDPSGPRATLDRFLRAAGARDFEGAHALLSARWRERVSPARLAADFEVEPLAARRLDLAGAAADRLQVRGSTARLPLGQGRALVLIEEAGGWRVDQLE